MRNQNEDWLSKTVKVGVVLILVFPLLGMLIGRLIFGNNPEKYSVYLDIMFAIATLFLIIFSIIVVVKYVRYEIKHEQEEEEKVNEELTSEYKKVLLNSSEPISEEYFECTAKIDNNGKIVCRVQLDHEMEFESSQKFLMYFHFVDD